MVTFTRWLARHHRFTLVVAGLAFFSTTGIASVSYSDNSDAAVTIGGVVLVGVLGLVLLIGAALVLTALAGVDPDAALIAERLVTDPVEQALLNRWLTRTRWARNVGGVAGLVWWLLGTSLRGDGLLLGLGGVALGSMAAQLHHVHRRGGPRTASLQRRSVTDYLPGRSKRHLIAVSVFSLAMLVGGLALGEGASPAIWGLVALVVLFVAYMVQRRVAARPRPALPAGLNAADDLARRLAIDRGLGQPAVYFALVLIAHGALDLEPQAGDVASWLAAGVWIFALVAWWKNRRLGLDYVLRAGPSALAGG